MLVSAVHAYSILSPADSGTYFVFPADQKAKPTLFSAAICCDMDMT